MLKPYPPQLKYLIVAAIIAVVIAVPLFLRKPRLITVSKMLMGTVVQVTVPEKDGPKAEAAFAEIKRLEQVLSSYKEDSDAVALSRHSGEMVKVRPETIEVLSIAKGMADMTEGAFDPTVGALSKLWGYSGEAGEAPEDADIKDALKQVGFKGLAIDREGLSAGLMKKGMAINLGGIAKGYIVGKAVIALKGQGVKKGIVKAGGDMAVWNEADDKPFNIGIQHPRKDGLLAEVQVLNSAVATSGDYERFFIKNGKRYHHILNPKTGYPAEGVLSATVIAKDPARADALSTAIFVMGTEKGMALIERLPDTEGIIVDENGVPHASKGFIGRVY
jgi:thiamine biosynthesis lipoprotein